MAAPQWLADPRRQGFPPLLQQQQDEQQPLPPTGTNSSWGGPLATRSTFVVAGTVSMSITTDAAYGCQMHISCNGVRSPKSPALQFQIRMRLEQRHIRSCIL